MELGCETGNLVLLFGTGQVLTSKFKKKCEMHDYYTKKVYLPPFSSCNRQRGSGIGALAAGIGRITLPFVKKFLLPQKLWEGIAYTKCP